MAIDRLPSIASPPAAEEEVVVAVVAGPLHGRRLLRRLPAARRQVRRLDHRLVRLEAHLHLDLLHHQHRGQP